MIRFRKLGAAYITPAGLIDPCNDDSRASVEVVAARDRSRVEAFAKQHGIPNVFDNYQEVVKYLNINAIYNPQPTIHNPLQIGLHHELNICVSTTDEYCCPKFHK